MNFLFIIDQFLSLVICLICSINFWFIFIFIFCSVILNQGWFCSPGDICQCPEIFLVNTTKGGGATGIWWVGARNDTNHLTMHSTAPMTKNYQAQNVISAKLRNSPSALYLLKPYNILKYIVMCWQPPTPLVSFRNIN